MKRDDLRLGLRHITNRFGNDVFAIAETDLPDASDGYAKGCILLDIVSGAVYVNTGTTSVAVFSRLLHDAMSADGVDIDSTLTATEITASTSVRVGAAIASEWIDADPTHVEFNSAGAASYIDQSGIGGSICIRTSNSTVLDTDAIIVTSGGDLQFPASPGFYAADGAFKFFPTNGDQAATFTLEPSGTQDSTAVYLKGDTGLNYHGFMFNQDGKSTYIRNEVYGSGSAAGVRRMLLQMSGTVALGIGPNGDVTLGSAVWPSANGGKVLSFADNAANPTMPSNTAGLFAKDVSGTVEMFAVDEGGNVTQLSPHDPASGRWVFSSYNMVTKIAKRVDMEWLIEVVERLSGESILEVRNACE